MIDTCKIQLTVVFLDRDKVMLQLATCITWDPWARVTYEPSRDPSEGAVDWFEGEGGEGYQREDVHLCCEHGSFDLGVSTFGGPLIGPPGWTDTSLQCSYQPARPLEAGQGNHQSAKTAEVSADVSSESRQNGLYYLKFLTSAGIGPSFPSVSNHVAKWCNPVAASPRKPTMFQKMYNYSEESLHDAGRWHLT